MQCYMEKTVVKKEAGATGQQFAELLCDFMFKRVFGSEANKDLLISFLNVLLEDVEIEDVDFIPTEHLGLTEDDRKVIFDISCQCKDGRTFIIEMQKGYQKHFRERAVYYTTYPINEQGLKAHDEYLKEKAVNPKTDVKFNWDYNLTPVTVVAILNFKFEHYGDWPQEKCHSSYRLREDGTGEIMTDVLRFVFLELGRFKKRIWELESVFDKWMYLLKHMHEMVVIPNEFDDPVFSNLFLLAKINNFTSDELKQYQKSLENMGEFENIINSTEERAREAGRTEGRTEGRAEIAVKMLSAGFSLDQIAQLTGLEISDIEKLNL